MVPGREAAHGDVVSLLAAKDAEIVALRSEIAAVRNENAALAARVSELEGLAAALHAQLAKGAPVGEAWRAATLSARQKTGAAPAGWAGLRLIGGDRR